MWALVKHRTSWRCAGQRFTAKIANKHAVEFTLAYLLALDPRVIEFRFASISTIVEPCTAKRATTEFAGALDNAALGAYSGGRRRGACEY